MKSVRKVKQDRKNKQTKRSEKNIIKITIDEKKKFTFKIIIM